MTENEKNILSNSHLSTLEICSKVGCSDTTVRRVLRKHGKNRPIGKNHRYTGSNNCKSSPESPKSFEPEEYFSETDDTANVAVVTQKPIRTLEDAIKAAKVDCKTWKVKSWETSNWTTAMKLKEKGNDKPVLVQCYRVKLKLERIMKKCLLDATDIVFERFKNHNPHKRMVYVPKQIGKQQDGYLGVLGLFDAHFGKLCWGEETGTDYDLKIAERLFSDAVYSLIEKSKHLNIKRWMAPLGNDYFHVDNSKNETFSGTRVDTDGRYAKIIATGELAFINAIEEARKIAPVDVVHVAGNHDPTTSFHLARTVSAWFRNCKDVTVDFTPSKRKYYHWKSTLLGMTHGDKEKKHDLTGLMPLERPHEFSNSVCREWLLGHEHRHRQFQTKVGDTHHGVVIRTLRSLSGTDGWHHENGFVGAGQAAEVYFYHENDGYAGHMIHTVKK